jgi:hypothetical protein
MAEKPKTKAKPKKVSYPTVGELNSMTMWEEKKLPFALVRRIPGGYMFEYEQGVAFVSNDEFRNI